MSYVNLFQYGDFTLNSGAKSKFKLECDALVNNDYEALAYMISQIVPSFVKVIGVPRGGVPLAMALEKYQSSNEIKNRLLIVDDVLTTGGSMERIKNTREIVDRYENIIGAVIFARGKCSDWIKPLFQLPEELWIRK